MAARRGSTRVVLNRSRLDELQLAWAEGLEEIARTIVETAKPPDATPFGEGLVTRGGYLVYVGAKKVAGGSLEGDQPKKPRAYRVAGTSGATAIAGFGFPARLQETGSVHQPARPFFLPAGLAVKDAAPSIMRDVVGSRLRASS